MSPQHLVAIISCVATVSFVLQASSQIQTAGPVMTAFSLMWLLATQLARTTQVALALPDLGRTKVTLNTSFMLQICALTMLDTKQGAS